MQKVLKTFLVPGIILGAFVGVVIGFVMGSWTQAAIWAAASGTLFGCVMVFEEVRLRNEFEGKYECAAGETLLREGMARHWEGTSHPLTGAGSAGYLYLTTRRAHFKPRARQSNARELDIALTDVVEATPYRTMGIHPNGLRIRTRRGDECFVVNYGKNEAWAAAISRTRTAQAAPVHAPDTPRTSPIIAQSSPILPRDRPTMP
jgi:hypothetical protein